MTKFPFAHDGRVYAVADDEYQIVYYARDGKKFKRIRRILTSNWRHTKEQEIDDDHFWMVVACIERRQRNA